MSAPLFHFPGETPAATTREWIVEDLFGYGDLVTVYGAPGSGKSALVADLAASVATGSEWFGRSVTTCPVLFVAAERASVTERRLVAVKLRIRSERLEVAISAGPMDLGDDSAVNSIIDLMTAIKIQLGAAPRLIIFDTLSRCAPTIDENSTRDVAKVIDRLARINNETGAATVIVHHGNKANGDLRGSSALLGAVDVAVEVNQKGPIRRARIAKNNDGPEGDVIATFRITDAPDGRTGIVNPITKPTAHQKSELPPDAATALDVLCQLTSTGPVSIDQWRHRFYGEFPTKPQDTKKKAFQRARTDLECRGLVASKGDTAIVSGTCRDNPGTSIPVSRDNEAGQSAAP